MDALRERLEALAKSARRDNSGRTSSRSPPVPGQPLTGFRPVKGQLADLLGGEERHCHGLCYWHLETPFHRACREDWLTRESFVGPLRHRATEGGEAIIEPRRAFVLDIETGGLCGAPVFLIGVVALDTWPLCVQQWLARDYPEEQAILRRMAAWAAERDTWITFNGKTFDEPLLRDRATRHHVRLRSPAVHVDLLVAARRRWRHQLSDCRLVTIESQILGRQRFGDVPGSDVPELFHHFFRTGNAAPLRPVLEHNRLDLIASTELLIRLSEP